MKGIKCSKEELIADYVRIKKELGCSPSVSEYKQAGGKYSKRPFIKHFGSWGDFTLQMGGEINKGGAKRLTEPDLNLEKYTDYIKIHSKNVIIIFDPHIPYHSINIINECLDVAERLDIDTLIIGGDFLDFKCLYTKEVQQTKIDWIDEIKEAVNVLNVLITHFKKIYIISGNHDHRLNRFLGQSDKAEKLMSILFNHPQVKYSKYQFCQLNDTWNIIHEGNTKVKLSKLEKIINVKRLSTMAGHSHRFAFGVHDSGIEVEAEGLHTSEKPLHEYANIKLSDHSEWIQGFWIIKNNQLAPYVKHPLVYNPFLK